jgi:hypothetical protein
MLMSFKKNERFYHLHEQINLFGELNPDLMITDVLNNVFYKYY